MDHSAIFKNLKDQIAISINKRRQFTIFKSFFGSFESFEIYGGKEFQIHIFWVSLKKIR
jgi:hypothetical protein